MSTHNIGFYEDLTKNYLSIIIKYHQIHTLSLLLRLYCYNKPDCFQPLEEPLFMPMGVEFGVK